MSSLFLRRSMALVFFTLCGAVQAHPGHGDSLMTGIAHPLLGWDHLLAMVAVGVWAYQLGGRARWMVPSSFVVLMSAAGGLSMLGFRLPLVEGGIATSVLILGLFMAFSVRMMPAMAAGLVALFAVFHGYAHGTEMPASATAWQFALGFIASTLFLHGCGFLLGRGLYQHLWCQRAAGTIVAVSGVWMMAVN